MLGLVIWFELVICLIIFSVQCQFWLFELVIWFERFGPKLSSDYVDRLVVTEIFGLGTIYQPFCRHEFRHLRPCPRHPKHRWLWNARKSCLRWFLALLPTISVWPTGIRPKSLRFCTNRVQNQTCLVRKDLKTRFSTKANSQLSKTSKIIEIG